MKSDVAPNEYQALANAISAVHSTSFTSQLCAFIQAVVPFDCSVVLGYRQGKRPVYLYDSINESRELLFQRYLTDSFQNDPFYRQIEQYPQARIYRLKDVLSSATEYKQYQREFYLETGWNDELCLSIPLDASRGIAIYLGVMADASFSAQHLADLQTRFAVLSSLCQQHWAKTAFSLPEVGDETLHLRHAIDKTLVQLGAELLTSREQEIAALLVQGFDSKEIASQLEIGVGTVKNHRKRIYAKLNISSLSELFRVFLSQLIAAG